MAHKKLIGDIMIEMGLASRDLITECLNKQTEIYQGSSKKVPIGKLLIKSGFITSEQLNKALEKQAKYRLMS